MPDQYTDRRRYMEYRVKYDRNGRNRRKSEENNEQEGQQCKSCYMPAQIVIKTSSTEITASGDTVTVSRDDVTIIAQGAKVRI
jgi:hypothetical protein